MYLPFYLFFKTVNYTSLVCKLDISLGIILDFCTMLLLEVTWWHILKGESYLTLIHFCSCFLINIHEKCKSNHQLFQQFFWSGNVTILVCKFYLSQVPKLNYLFWTCPKLWEMFIFKGFYLYLLLYIYLIAALKPLHSKLHFFGTLWRVKLLFTTKSFLRYTCIYVFLFSFFFFLSKKQQNWFFKIFHNSGMVELRKPATAP